MKNIYLFHVYECSPYLYMDTTHVQKPEEGIGYPGNGDTEGC